MTDPLDRRGFLTTSLIAGFTLATARAEGPAIHTDTAGLDAREVQIPVQDGSLPAYLARPARVGSLPIVLVTEEIFGVHEYIKDICRRLAKQGYLAIAAEYYARLGDLSKMTSIEQLLDVVARAPDGRMMADMDEVAAWAARNHGDPGRLGITGFCRGGRQTWLYATHNPSLRAAVAWYGPLDGKPTPIQPKTVLDLVGALKCPVLGFYGGQDPSIPQAQIQRLEAEARQDHKTIDIVVYQDAGHGFHADYRPSYREADAKDGWQRMLGWFRRYGVA